jgi:hypothetical protein
MKKVLLCSLLLFAMFAACKKENGKDPDPQTTRYPVRFNVSGFSQVTQEFGERDAQDTLRDYLRHLYYIVYTSTGNVVKRINQEAGDSSFGVILDSLSSGTYTIALLGSKDEVYIGPSFLGTEDEMAYLTLPGTDVFYRKVIITISGAINQQITMDRIVAKVKLIIKDAIPVDAKQLTISPQTSPPPPPEIPGGLPAGLMLFTGEITVGARLSASYLPFTMALDSLAGITNFTSEFYLLTMGQKTITIGLSCQGTGGVTLTEKVIENVNIEVGKRTVLSGNLFDQLNNGGKGVHVIINNPEWSSDSILVEY